MPSIVSHHHLEFKKHCFGLAGTDIIQVLRDELETAMRLCGLTDLADASPDYVNTSDVDHLVRVGGHPYARKVRRPGSKL